MDLDRRNLFGEDVLKVEVTCTLETRETMAQVHMTANVKDQEEIQMVLAEMVRLGSERVLESVYEDVDDDDDGDIPAHSERE